jgi:hypothetical protein
MTSTTTNVAEKHYLYGVYKSMKARCYRKTSENYIHYGERNISVCEKWLEPKNQGFWNFVNDMGERPNGYSIDRIDNNGNYEPSNCKWSTKHEQSSNARKNNKNVGVALTSNKRYYRAKLVVNKITYEKLFHTEQEAIDYRKELELLYLKA